MKQLLRLPLAPTMHWHANNYANFGNLCLFHFRIFI